MIVVVVVVVLLAAKCLSNIQVYLRDGSAQALARAAAWRLKLQVKLASWPACPSTDPTTPGACKGGH